MVTYQYTPAVHGGAERQAQYLAEGLAGRGWRVAVATVRFPGLAKHEVIAGVDVHRLWAVPRPGRLSPTFLLSLIRFLLTRGREFDIWHAHQAYYNAGAALLLAPLLEKRCVIKTAASGPYGDVARLRRTSVGRFTLKRLPRADVFVTVNTGLTRELEDIGVPSGRIHLIPNGVDSDRFVPSTPAERQAARATLGLPLETVLVLYVGRLAPEKGVDTLLDAWAMVEATPDTNGLALVLVGDGPAAEQYRERARAELQHTWFLGRLDDVRPALQAADLLVLPSLSEGMSNAVLEAMAAGLPTVATRIDGLTAQIEDGVTGLLVPPGDVDVLRGALLRLSLDPAYRSALGERARRVVERKYRPEIVLEAYEDLYRQLVSNDREEPACL